MKTETQKREREKEVSAKGGFHLICGTGPKNGIWDNTAERVEKGHVLDLTELHRLLIADIDYFIMHHEEILEMARKKQYEYLKYDLDKEEKQDERM